MIQNIIEIKNLQKRFPIKKSFLGKPKEFVHAVNSVDIKIPQGQTVGLVGESGCGKTTVGRLITGLDTPDDGKIFYNGQPIDNVVKEDKTNFHKKVQIIFQNPYSSLNPRQRIFQTFREVLSVHKIVPKEKVEEETTRLLEIVGITPDYLNNYPFEFSGGQRQRLCIARALAVKPEVVICDEPVSALDVSIQSQILLLLKELQEKFHLSYLFISHDLSVVYHICNSMYIMYLGKIMEKGGIEEIFKSPKHPYTEALLKAVPVPDPKNKRKHIVLSGDVPDPVTLPKGCPFHSRCPKCLPICKDKKPIKTSFSPTHEAACWLYEKT